MGLPFRKLKLCLIAAVTLHVAGCQPLLDVVEHQLNAAPHRAALKLTEQDRYVVTVQVHAVFITAAVSSRGEDFEKIQIRLELPEPTACEVLSANTPVVHRGGTRGYHPRSGKDKTLF